MSTQARSESTIPRNLSENHTSAGIHPHSLAKGAGNGLKWNLVLLGNFTVDGAGIICANVPIVITKVLSNGIELASSPAKQLLFV